MPYESLKTERRRINIKNVAKRDGIYKYEIQVNDTVIHRRFSEFRKLHQKLKVPSLPSLPDTGIMSYVLPFAVIDTRSIQLQKILRAIERDDDVRQSQEFRQFIQDRKCYVKSNSCPARIISVSVQ